MNPLYPPLPITKMHVTKDRWLMTKVKYEDELTIKDILNVMNDKTDAWLTDKDDLSLVIDPDTFKDDFIDLIYDYKKDHNYDNSHMTESEENLFDLKYLEEINTLFLSLKDLDNYYNTNIIQGDFNELFKFIKYNVTIQEFNDSSDEEDISEI